MRVTERPTFYWTYNQDRRQNRFGESASSQFAFLEVDQHIVSFYELLPRLQTIHVKVSRGITPSNDYLMHHPSLQREVVDETQQLLIDWLRAGNRDGVRVVIEEVRYPE